MLTFYYTVLILHSNTRGGLGETDAEQGNRVLVLLDVRAEGDQERGAFYSLTPFPTLCGNTASPE